MIPFLVETFIKLQGIISIEDLKQADLYVSTNDILMHVKVLLVQKYVQSCLGDYVRDTNVANMYISTGAGYTS